MRGDTSDRVGGPPRVAEDVVLDALSASVAAAATLVDVQRLVARLAQLPGVLVAALTSAGHVPRPLELCLPVGVPGWRLELRVTVADEESYGRIQRICRQIAGVADRVLSQGCLPAAGGVASTPPPMYRAISAGTPTIIVSVDPAGGWAVHSDAFRDVLGYDRHAPPGGRLIDLIHPDDHATAVGTFVTACSGRHPVDSVDLRVFAADGRTRVLAVTTHSFVDDPQLGVVMYFALDVTATRAAGYLDDIDRERLCGVVDTLPDGILMLDDERRVELVNDAGRRLFEDAEASCRDWEQLLQALSGRLDHNSTTVARLRQAVAGERSVIGEELDFQAGRVVELDVLPVRRSERRLGTLVHVRDVTTRVSVRRGLEQRTRGLEERNRSLTESSALNNEFVATVAHELRGPLSSVVAFSHLLGDAASGGLNDDQRTYLDVIDRNANRLLRLIEDLLLLSRLESRTLQLRLTTVSVADLLAAAVAERAPAAALAGITLRCEAVGGPELVCDDIRIHQVVENLVGNALKFTPNGGEVNVRARSSADAWIIEVADSGIGIPAVDLPRLFQAFFRGALPASSVARQAPPGTGLGLVVSRAIVELHGGSISVASTEGVGTTVTLSLPARPIAKDGG
ncbi:MAG TPA: ATP-binding protein [Micromonosporaceae bacterium]|nr:ATP-binding protein [Micromonosporaceae bacterium]